MIIKTVKTAGELNDAYAVRREVFVNEQRVPASVEKDEHDEKALHVIAYEGETPIGAGRLRIDGKAGKVERLCVKKAYRNKGVGRKMMAYIEDVARTLHLHQLNLHAQIDAQHFYQQFGYKSYSDLFYEAGMPHVAMKKGLNNQAR